VYYGSQAALTAQTVASELINTRHKTETNMVQKLLHGYLYGYWEWYNTSAK